MARNVDGLYAAVLAERKLPEKPPEDQRSQGKVDEIKRGVATRDAVALAEAYVALRDQFDKAKAVASAIGIKVTAYAQLLMESQDAQAPGWGAYGVKGNSIRLESGYKVRIQVEPSAKIVDKDALRAWALANDYERDLTLPAQTVNSIVKERLLNGEAEPPGTQVYSWTRVWLDSPRGE